MPLTPRQTLQNRYRIGALLGQGGMGAVYRAWDTRLDVPVAVKELVPQSGLDASTLDRLQQQFVQEAKVLARLRHPHLVNVTDYFEEVGNAYLVMEFVAGESLAERIAREGALDEAQVLTWGQQLLSALAYCHGRQVLHRDLKPQNIILTPEGEVMLVDFGLVKLWDPADPYTRTAIRGAGTPEYAPPEQYDMLRGHTDARSDIYSLGATLYHALTGLVPPTVTQRIVNPQALRPLRKVRPDLSATTEVALMRALELQPSRRLKSATALAVILSPPVPDASPLLAGPPQVKPTKVSPAAAPVYRSRSQRIPIWEWVVAMVVVVAFLTMGLSGLGGGETPVSPVVAEITVSPEPTATAMPSPTVTPTSVVSTAIVTRTREHDGMVMIYVPAGEFMRGSEEGRNNERPVLPVYVDAFWFDRTEVTNAQWSLCVEAGVCRPSEYADDRDYNAAEQPVVGVSWNDAVAYAAWVGGRLPTEAEWEYAAGGPEAYVYPWGNQAPTCELANYGDCVGRTALVGSYPEGASWVGALDLAGNVWEWVADWYGEYPSTGYENPSGPTSGSYRVLRGGSFFNNQSGMRCAYRGGGTPSGGDRFSGFRVVVSP